jgi:hypothetical protein
MDRTYTEDDPLIINDAKKAIKYEQQVNNTHRKGFRGLKGCLIFIGIITSFFIIVTLFASNPDHNPAHISYTDSNTDNITATWITYDYTPNTLFLEYYKDTINKNITKTSVAMETTQFVTYNTAQYAHRANFIGLDHNATYIYNIKNHDTMIGPFTIHIPEENKHTNNILFFSDIGLFYTDTRTSIINNILVSSYDFLFHLGDIVSNCNSYVSNIRAAASNLPYMTIPGCHSAFNFSSYKNMFTMPNYTDTQNLYYTIEKPPVKMINFNTEAYYYDSMAPTLNRQKQFILYELQNTNRTKFPWLIAAGHTPMYCSHFTNTACEDKVRVALEDMFVEYNLTLYISTHQNSYQRLCPIYNGICQTNITNLSNFSVNTLKYPIHIIMGADSAYYNFGVLESDYKTLHWTGYGIDDNNDPIKIDQFQINMM